MNKKEVLEEFQRNIIISDAIETLDNFTSKEKFADHYNKILEQIDAGFKCSIITDHKLIKQSKNLEWIDHGDYAIAYDPINKSCLMKIKEEEKMEKKELMNAKDLISLCMIYPNISITADSVKEEVNRIINSDEMYNAITGAMQNDETCVKFNIRYSFKLFYQKLKYSDNLYRLFKSTMIEKMREKEFTVTNFQFEPRQFSFLVDWKQAMTEKICEDDKVEE